MKTYSCQLPTCGKDIESYVPRRYCNNRCQHDHRMLLSEEKFDVGEITHFHAQKRILTKRFGYKCSIPECGIESWLGSPLVLQVDHIDGNPDNNRGTNLRLLCPNCHAQTPTYKGGNKKSPKQDSRSRRNRKAYARSCSKQE